jgi:PAS domain S-box-containing protein
VLSRKKKIRLQQCEDVYRVLFEDASDAIVIIDFATQRVLDANRQAEILTGYSKTDLLTMTITDFWMRENEKRLAMRVLRSVAEYKSVTLQERQIYGNNGRLLWVEMTVSAIESRGKQAILAIVRDISQHKQIELEREVIDTVHNALISSHNIQDVYKIVGQNLLKVLYFDWMDILLPGSTSQKLRVFASFNLNKNISNLEEREYTYEGTTIKAVFQTGMPEIVDYSEESSNRSIPELLGKQLQVSLFFPLESKGKVIGVLHFGSYRRESFAPRYFDFLWRIASQLAITIENMLLSYRVNEESVVYKHLIENVNEIVLQVDPKGTIIFVNHRVRDVLGYTPDEITGTNFFSYVFPEDLEEARAAFRLALRHEQPLSGEYRAFHKNGTVLTIAIYTRPILEDGRAVGMQGIIQNLTPPPNRFTAPRNGLHDLIGRSPRMQEIYALIMSVAETDSTVLIHGESGTGKELIAQAIHTYSHRKSKPFIVVNCAAYSEHLLESELFGHERGAFTGAHRRKLGRFELAKGGTIFLDEVGEIPLYSQLSLLRVIQNKTFERVGGEKTLEADVRIVAATNKRLVEEMKAGRFREDLYYRLNVISIDVPPLRERKEDIPYLVEHFLKKYSSSTGKQVLKCSQSAIELLMYHDWYGNVRELENAIERAVVMASGPVITPIDLPATLQRPGEVVTKRQDSTTEKTPSLYEHEKQLILQALQATNWNKYQTAKLLGITRSTLYSKIGKYHLSPDSEHNIG